MPPRKRVATTRAAKTTTRAARAGDVQVLKASNVELPLTGTPVPASPEILRIRSDFLAGKQLSRGDLNQLVASAEGGGNGNCGIC